MALLQDNTPSDKIKAAYGIKESSLLPTISPELVPVVIVDDLSELTQERLCVAQDVRAAAGAGNVNTWRLANPAASAVIVTITSIQLHTDGVNQAFRWNTSDVAALPTTLTPQFIDLRVPGFPVAVWSFTATAVAIVASSGYRTGQINQLTLTESLPSLVTLTPGDQLTIQQEAANSAAGVAFFWKERDLTPTD